MIFRCPWCGEKAFTTGHKLGLSTQYFPRHAVCCSACGKYSARKSSFGKWSALVKIPLVLVLVFLAVMAVLLKLNGTLPQPLLWTTAGVMALGLLFLPFFLYYLCHFEKTLLGGEVSRGQEERFGFSAPREGRLWPMVRRGEIYPIRVVRQDTLTDTPLLYGQLEDVEKGVTDYRFVVRIVRRENSQDVKVGDTVRLIASDTVAVTGKVVTPPMSDGPTDYLPKK